MHRAVVDPNVLISAYLSLAGATAEVFRLALDGRFQPVACPQLLDELGRVLTRSRHLKRYRDPVRIEAFMAALGATVELHPDLMEETRISPPRAWRRRKSHRPANIVVPVVTELHKHLLTLAS